MSGERAPVWRVQLQAMHTEELKALSDSVEKEIKRREDNARAQEIELQKATYGVKVVCDDCEGSGEDPEEAIPCDKCDGKGWFWALAWNNAWFKLLPAAKRVVLDGSLRWSERRN